MALDGMYLSFLAREVNELLVGAKVDKIHQPSKKSTSLPISFVFVE